MLSLSPMRMNDKLNHQSLLDLELTRVDGRLNIAGVLTINSAADRDGGSEHLFDGTSEGGGVRLGAHLLSNFNDVIELDFTAVDDVLNLLSVSWWLLQCLQDEWGGSGQHSHMANSVLHHDLDVNPDSFPL